MVEQFHILSLIALPLAVAVAVAAGFAVGPQQLGGYGNQVLMQFPNCLVFFGGLAIVYILPHLEDDWEIYENELLAKQEEKERLKLEKKKASRVG